MIEGIEVLSQAEVGTNIGMNWTVFWTIVGFCFFVGFLIMAFSTEPTDFGEWVTCAAVGLLGGLVGCIFGAMLGTYTGKPTEFETQYKVTISDEVQMNEFLEKYEIIDQDGKIYIIRENTENE